MTWGSRIGLPLDSEDGKMADENIEQMVEAIVAKKLAELEEEKKYRTKRLAIVASKGSLDMAYPPLILSSTAVSLGWECKIFCTFYGLDIVNKHKLPALKVAPVGNPAMPEPIKGIPFQVPNIMGMLPGATALGTALMKSWFSKANIPPLKELIDVTMEGGGELVACATTMGVMGVTVDDLIPGVGILGATAFLDYASGADVSLFV
jgi:peroxiredoxin family protein